MIDAETLLSNIATASQNRSIADDPVTRGAILREVARYMRQFGMSPRELEQHPDFDR